MANPVKKVLEFPRQERAPAIAVKAPAVELEAKEQKLQDEIIEAFICLRKAHRYTEDDIKLCEAVISDFLAFSGKAFWDCNELDFNRWGAHLGLERKVSVATQRKYQGYVRSCYDFTLESPSLMAKIQIGFGVRPQQVATERNCIPHVLKREVKGKRPALSPKQIECLFKSLDSRILMAGRFKSKSYYPLMRDRVIFYYLYATQLRISESNDADLDSLQENPRLPELGDFGFTATMRKGSKGSGKKFQQVPTDCPELPGILQWYLEKVRPYFAIRKRCAGEPLFLTERGERMTYEAAYIAFKKALREAGLDTKKFALHSLRRTGATHEVGDLSLLAIQHKMGHEHLQTTMGYLDIPDEQVSDEISRTVRSRIKAAKARKKKE